jgi:hypothetical protein
MYKEVKAHFAGQTAQLCIVCEEAILLSGSALDSLV